MSDFKGTMYNVYSGNIAKAGWMWNAEEKRGILQIEFRSNRTYQYFPVDKKYWTEFWQAESKGQYFNENIKNNILIEYEEVFPEE